MPRINSSWYTLSDKLSVSLMRYKAHLLAFPHFRYRQVQGLCYFGNLSLCVITYREFYAVELVLGKPVQEITLVFMWIHALFKNVFVPVMIETYPRIMAGGYIISTNAKCLFTKERKLYLFITFSAGVRGPSFCILITEIINYTLFKLFMCIPDIIRDLKLFCRIPCKSCFTAGAVMPLTVKVIFLSPYPECGANYFVALFNQQQGCNR